MENLLDGPDNSIQYRRHREEYKHEKLQSIVQDSML